MINEITCNSNNAIEMSRGELLSWLNSLLKLNYSKIQQLGSGAAYCQLLDLIYPGKVPLSKVNWKAKFDYEYVNNFKVLQQSFTKLNVLKHIQVEKLVKCKYQDNLEFLQWFKKIFDSTGSQGKQYDPVTRRGDKEVLKENKNPTSQTSINDNDLPSKQMVMSLDAHKQSLVETENEPENLYKNQLESNYAEQNLQKYHNHNEKIEERLLNIFSENQNEQKQYYLRKIKQIQYLMDTFNTEKSSKQLIQNIRKIILVAPEVEWSIQDGNFKQTNEQ